MCRSRTPTTVPRSAIATDLAKRGPALGILQVLATQRPDAKAIPSDISTAAVLRMCLKVMRQIENDKVLGQSAHKNGYKATMFDFDDKGIFYFSGEGSAPRICRAHEIDGPAATKIAARARVMRENAGRLTGYALGEDQDTEARSFLADVLAVFGTDSKLWSETIAERLSESMPGVYADITKDAVGSQLRALEVTVKRVRETGKDPRWGCERRASSRRPWGPGADTPRCSGACDATLRAGRSPPRRSTLPKIGGRRPGSARTGRGTGDLNAVRVDRDAAPQAAGALY